MTIKNFDDIQKNIGLPEKILQDIEERMRSSANGAEFLFTDLQLKAFNEKEYWTVSNGSSFPRHIVVQGATSSGKTLISELSVIECLYDRPKKKTIILVPLKAMVRERRDHFANDLSNERVYASSSDFQDHDTDIINGDYDVAVIVYEKFFAMLSQPSTQILNDCALLVVDELQMLSSEGRGPKLEISIQKVMRHNAELGTDNPQGTYTRIMCLTTCDCKIDYIKKWLSVDDIEPLTIVSHERPIGLEEYVLNVNGILNGRYIKGERDIQEHEDAFKENPDPILVEGYNKNNRPEVAKRLVLIALLKRIYERNPDAKVLIFASDRRRTQNLAEYIIRNGDFSRTGKTEGLISELQNYENDEGQMYLKQLLPYGVAFHNSTLSTALREFVEKGFEKEIKLVVATETLTIGMNMPVDVMILYDTKVPRGKENREELTSQEYKNFVGRAGRLGLSNEVGQSYVLALNESEAEKYRNMYVNCRMQDIKSSLLVATEDIQAPYYLSLLTARKKYQISSLNELQEASFSRKCGGRAIEMEKVMRELKKASLCTQKEIRNEFEEDDDLENEKPIREYEMSELGQVLSPYALHLSTCKKIKRYFLNGGYRKYKTGEYEKNLEEGAGGIPEGISAKDIESDRYLLDILFLLCSTQEIRNLGQLRIPIGDNQRNAKDIIWEKLEKMTSPGDNGKIECELWPNSKLQYIKNGKSEHETEDLQTVMRAIMLWYWTKGATISEIRSKTNFKQFLAIYSGDLARLGELVSYELDAIYRCTSHFSRTFKIKYDQRGPSAIYALSTRVSYGMPRDLVRIANRHVYGMDRSVVLKIGQAAHDAGYDSPVKFMAQGTKEELEGLISESRRNELLSMIDRIYFRDDMGSLLDSIQRNQVGEISNEELNALRQLYDLKPSDENKVYEILQMIFKSIGEESKSYDRFFDNAVLLKEMNLSGSEIFINEKRIIIADYDNEMSISNINEVFSLGDLNILLVRERNILQQILWDNSEGKWYLEWENGIIKNVDVAMTCQNFAVLLAQTMALEDKKCLMLSSLLHDLTGAFTPKSNKAIYCLLKNYQMEKHYSKDIPSTLKIVCDYQCGNEIETVEKLFAELESRRIDFRVISWGECLKEENGTSFTLMYISKGSLATKSMQSYFEKVQSINFRNVFAVFDNETDYLKLSGDPESPYVGLKHFSAYSQVKKAEYIQYLTERKKMVDEDENTYYIGVSYSHRKVNGKDRPAVVALRKIILGLNSRLGEENILFDENPSCRDKFSRNNALPETLELYKQCSYYIILDDEKYNTGEACPREAEVIKEKLNNKTNKYSQKVWFLRPKNDTGSFLFNAETDYSTLMDYTDENIQNIIESIFRVIVYENK